LNLDCDYGWKYYNNYCYTLANFYDDFLGANNFCKEINSKSSIVMPKTQDIINFINNNWELSNGFWVIFLFKNINKKMK
jgi:hypothetical protein